MATRQSSGMYSVFELKPYMASISPFVCYVNSGNTQGEAVELTFTYI